MKRSLTPEMIEELRRMYVDEHLSARDICDRTGVSYSTLHSIMRKRHWFDARQRHCREAGIKPDPDSRSPRSGKRPDPKVIEEMHRLYVYEQLPAKEAAALNGIKLPTFYGYSCRGEWKNERIAERQRQGLPPERDSRCKYIDWSPIRLLYLRTGYHWADLARLFNIPQSTVRNYAKRHHWKQDRQKHLFELARYMMHMEATEKEHSNDR